MQPIKLARSLELGVLLALHLCRHLRVRPLETWRAKALGGGWKDLIRTKADAMEELLVLISNGLIADGGGALHSDRRVKLRRGGGGLARLTLTGERGQVEMLCRWW